MTVFQCSQSFLRMNIVPCSVFHRVYRVTPKLSENILQNWKIPIGSWNITLFPRRMICSWYPKNWNFATFSDLQCIFCQHTYPWGYLKGHISILHQILNQVGPNARSCTTHTTSHDIGRQKIPKSWKNWVQLIKKPGSVKKSFLKKLKT